MCTVYVAVLCLINILSINSVTKCQVRESSFPYISGDSFRALADHLFDETKLCKATDIKYKDIVFIKTDFLGKFFTEIHPRISHKYFIISHNSDLSAPDCYEHFLNDEKILAWFGQNPTVMHHPKFIPIPIGIANKLWSHGNVDTITNILRANIVTHRPYLLGINFNVGSAAHIRRPIFDFFSRKKFCTNIASGSHKTYLKFMTQAKFIVSPPGNGLDCHRTWEIFYCGGFPVCKHSTLDELLCDLPVLLVDDWNQVTEEYLNEQYIKISQNKNYNYEKIYMSYWIRLIEYYKIHCH